MKITGVRTALVDVPLEKPVRTSIHDIRSIGYVLVFVDTEDGVTGEGCLFTLSGRHLDTLEAMVLDLGRGLVGADARRGTGLWHRLWREIGFLGTRGVSVFALSAIDMAIWDARGKALGQPVHRLLGSCRDRVQAYASGGLWLSESIDGLAREARALRDEGFRAMKMRVGLPRWQDDAERVEAVREAVGPDCTLMVDANQGLTVEHALRLGRSLERFDLAWFEEPVPAWNVSGHAALARALDTPIATGESEYGRHAFRALIEAGGADVLMPDLARVGGVTEFVRVAHMAQAWDLPVSPHIFPEYSLQLCGALENCALLEHMPWFGALFREEMEMRDGEVRIPDRPGLGFTFDLDGLERHRVGSGSGPARSAGPAKPAAPPEAGAKPAAEPAPPAAAPRRDGAKVPRAPWY